MSISTLRGLAKAYSDSIIDRKQYIRQRRELIDDIVAGVAEIVPYESPSENEQPQLDRTFSDGEDTLELPLIDELTEDSSDVPNKSTMKTIFLGLVIVGAVVSGWILVQPASDNVEPTKVAAELPATPTVRLEDNARDLLGPFLIENQWQNERLEALTTQWLAQEPSVRRSANDSPIVHQMIEIIGQKYLEETALLALSDRQEILARQRRLLDLAAALSPQSERVQRLEAEWDVARNEQPENLIADKVSSPAPVAHTVSDSAEPIEQAVEPAIDETLGESISPLLDSTTESSAAAEPQQGAGIEAQGPAITDSTIETETSETVPSTTSDDTNIERITAVPAVVVTTVSPTSLNNNETKKVTPTKKHTVKKSACRAELAKRRRPYCYDPLNEKTNGPQLAVLPVGTFKMGGKSSKEQPQRSITVDRPFAVSINPGTTQTYQWLT